MKTNYIYGAAVALAMLATGCSDDLALQVQTPAEQGRQVRVSASMGADSRLAITDTGKRLQFAWESTDAFHVFNAASSQSTTFVIDPEEFEENSPMATFVATPSVAYGEGDKLYAVYNTLNDTLKWDENGNLLLDISQQNGQLDERFQYLFAETVYSEDEEPAFAFKHLVTMLKLNISVPEHVTSLKSVSLRYNGLPTRATLVLNRAKGDTYNQFKPGDLVACYNYDNGSVNSLTINGDFVAKDGVVTVYFYAFPVKRYYESSSGYNDPWLEPAVWMTDSQGNDYVSDNAFNSKNIEAGKTYQLNTGVLALEPFANEATATGLENSPYEIATAAQLYTFMHRASKGMRNPLGRDYSDCSYVLTADIELDNEMLWVPFNIYSATIDGMGHTISGNILMHSQYQTGLFSYSSNCTIQNLALDLNVTFDQYDYNNEYFGMLVGEAYKTSIINCVNHSDVSGRFWRMGGLVGNMNWRSSLIACGNTGDLTAMRENRQMGGIVAETTNSDVQIEGCYNTGQFNVNTMYWEGLEVGGIVGKVGHGATYVQNCWNNATLTIENVTYDDHIIDASHNIFFGAIVGYQNAGEIRNCYWNESVEFAAGYKDGEVTGCGTFVESIPTAAQFAVMNAAMTNLGWKFNEDGTVGKVTGVSTPSMPKEEW